MKELKKFLGIFLISLVTMTALFAAFEPQITSGFIGVEEIGMIATLAIATAALGIAIILSMPKLSVALSHKQTILRADEPHSIPPPPILMARKKFFNWASRKIPEPRYKGNLNLPAGAFLGS